MQTRAAEMSNIRDEVKVHDIKKNIDDRGFFAEILREDWKDFIAGDWVTQANLSMSYPGIIRAWHRHARGQVDIILCLKGSIQVNVYDGEKGSATYGQLAEVVISEERLQAVRYPGRFWHGTKTVSNERSMSVYFSTRLYDYTNPDEERRPWNDPTIIEPKTGKPYEWNKVRNR